MKSSSILKKSENDIEFYSENNLPFVEEAKNETIDIEKNEERKKPKNVVIKKSTDQKYLLSFNIKKQPKDENNQTEEQLTSFFLIFKMK